MNEQPWYLNLFNQEILKNLKDVKTMSEELKPCPFCGGKSILVPLASCHGYIACIGECGFHTGDYWDAPMTEEEKTEKNGISLQPLLGIEEYNNFTIKVRIIIYNFFRIFVK